MHSYSFSNKTIHSYLDIPLLSKAKNRLVRDILISKNDDLPIPKISNNQKSFYSANLKNISIFFKDVAVIRITERGSLIEIKELTNLSNNFFFFNKLLNHIIPYAIYQSGGIVLHSSSISCFQKGILFLGKSGSGKSSLSASFKDCKFISEDSISISINERVLGYPSYPYAKLSTEIAKELNFDLSAGHQINGDSYERSSYKMMNFIEDVVEIKIALFLEWGNSFSIEKGLFNDILPKLIYSNYNAFPLASCPQSQKIQFKQLTDFYNKVPCYVLTRNRENLFLDNKKILEFIKFC